jgi:hypothetical protein
MIERGIPFYSAFIYTNLLKTQNIHKCLVMVEDDWPESVMVGNWIGSHGYKNHEWFTEF